jgi:hypothetical protein
MSEISSISPRQNMTLKSLSSVTPTVINIDPENTSSFTQGVGATTKSIFFSLPSMERGLISGADSSICFDLECSEAAATLANGSASSLLNAFSLIIGGQTIENLGQYGAFAAVVEDFQSSTRSKNTQSLLCGASTSAIKTGAALANTIRVSIPIYSGIIGSMSSNYCVATAAGMRCELTFESPAVCLIHATLSPTYSVSNLAMRMTYLQVEPSVWNDMMNESGGVMRCTGTAVTNHSAIIDPQSARHSVLIPSRVSSLQSYLTVFRKTAGVNNQTINSCGSRTNLNIIQSNYRYQGKSYPPKAVRGSDGTNPLAGEQFIEAQKCFGQLHSVESDVVFGLAEYLDQVGTSKTASHVIGHSFEEAGVGSDIMTAFDTMNSNTYLELDIVASSGTVVCDTFALHDIAVSFDMRSGLVAVSR